MRRLVVPMMLIVALCLPGIAGAQQKRQKDPALQTYLEEQFAQLNRKLGELSDHVAALELEVTRIKQQQTDAATEIRNTQNIARNTDTSLSNYRLTNQQDINALKNDLAKIQQELTSALEARKNPAPEAPKVEGYITVPPEDGKDVCTINKGSAAGVKVGMRFQVFKMGDPATQVGLLEVTEVLDPNNSRVKIIQSKPGVKLEFSDVVRAE